MKEARNTREIIEQEYLNSILDYRDGALFWKKNAGPKGKRTGLQVVTMEGVLASENPWSYDDGSPNCMGDA